jgi:hypothetical protein
MKGKVALEEHYESADFRAAGKMILSKVVILKKCRNA